MAAGIRRLESAAVAIGVMYRPIIVTTSPDRTVSRVSIPLAGNGDNPKSIAALGTLRHTVLPATLGNLDGVQYAVTGQTAGTKDFNDMMKARMGFVIAFVLGLAFILLLATFRSIVIPITAICLNLLSVGAAYGLLVLIFQHTWAESAARLHLERRDRLVAADVPLRRPVRALDGLQRVHPQPDQGAPRQRRDDRGRGLARDPANRRHRHERRDHHGRRLRDLRHAAADPDEAARGRARARDPDRRDRDPRRSCSRRR